MKHIKWFVILLTVTSALLVSSCGDKRDSGAVGKNSGGSREQRTEALGLLGPLAKDLAPTNSSTAEVAVLLQRLPNLSKLGEDDCRILDNAQNAPLPNGDMPVAYCLFQNNNPPKGTKIVLSESLLKALSRGIKASLAADPTTLEDERDPRVSPYGEGSSTAIGWALFDTGGRDYGIGVSFLRSSGYALFILIEPETPLCRWIMSARYRTNIVSAALQQSATQRTPYVGTWKAHDGTVFVPHGATLKIEADGTFKFNSGGHYISGAYVVAKWQNYIEDFITLITDGGNLRDYCTLKSGCLELPKFCEDYLKQGDTTTQSERESPVPEAAKTNTQTQRTATAIATVENGSVKEITT